MKNIYESILSSTNSGKSFMLSDPDAFAKQYLKLNPQIHYFVSDNVLFITALPNETKTFVIDKNFPDIKFKIGQITGLGKRKIIIKDWKVFMKYFGKNYNFPVELGCSVERYKTTTYIQDPNFVSTSGPSLDRIIKIKGNLVIDAAAQIQWNAFPDVDGDITINAKKIGKLILPISSETSIIKIKR